MEPLGSAALHHAIMRGFVDDGHAPTSAELARRLEVDEPTVHAGLRRLADEHGVVLHPDRPEVWVAHPFANAPTPFLVRCGGRGWWGTCAWCSLGVAALVEDGRHDVTITTTLGAEGSPVTLVVRGGVVVDDDYVVHFPVPMRDAWHNVLYTCQVMLLFRKPEDVHDWSRRHGVPIGDIRPVSVVNAFARDWYGRHLDPDWRKWTAAEAEQIFARHGLTGETWRLPASGERF
jgi:hypothetical protein